MGGGLAVRRAVAGDVAALRVLSCFKPGEKYARDAQRLVRGGIADELEDPELGVEILVAENGDGHVVGVIAWSGASRTMFIHVLAVDKGYWRQGYGTALKQTAMEAAAAQGFSIVRSEVHKMNSRMKNLNKKLGIKGDKDPDDGEVLMFAAKLATPQPLWRQALEKLLGLPPWPWLLPQAEDDLGDADVDG